MKKPKNVDEYINNSPKDIKPELIKLRRAIKESAPKAEESISYGMPYYSYHGRLVYFRYGKSHIGLYIMAPTVNLFKKELKNYSTTNVTIRFQHGDKLPISLIKRMVRTKYKLNENTKK